MRIRRNIQKRQDDCNSMVVSARIRIDEEERLRKMAEVHGCTRTTMATKLVRQGLNGATNRLKPPAAFTSWPTWKQLDWYKEQTK